MDKNAEYSALWNKAVEAGNAAAKACQPTPMVVQQHANMLDDNSPVVYREVVNDGVCGFSWITVRPANSAFANWAKKALQARKGVYGGLTLWCPLPTQSMQLKEAWCGAVAVVLRASGINAHMESRMD